MTNFEYIRTCSDMELAVFLNERIACFDGCPPYANMHCDLFDYKCHRCWSYWLNDAYVAEYYTMVREENGGMTNLDKIRSMSVGELKDYIKKDSLCYHRSAEECNHYDNCDDCFIDWCEEEAAD